LEPRSLGRVALLPEVGEKESITMKPPPSTTAPIGPGSLVRRRAVVAASTAVDHDETAVAKGTEARFHGSFVSGMTMKICSPGLVRNQPPAYAAKRMPERVDVPGARYAAATPAPRITAPGRTFMTDRLVSILGKATPGRSSAKINAPTCGG
jgi:hypothetical protein